MKLIKNECSEVVKYYICKFEDSFSLLQLLTYLLLDKRLLKCYYKLQFRKQFYTEPPTYYKNKISAFSMGNCESYN